MWQREKEKEKICKNKKKRKEITRNSVEKSMSRPKIK